MIKFIHKLADSVEAMSPERREALSFAVKVSGNYCYAVCCICLAFAAASLSISLLAEVFQ